MKEDDYNAEKSGILCRKNIALGHLKDSITTYNFLASHKRMPEGIFVDVQLNYKLHMSDTRLIMNDITWTVMRKTMMRTLRKCINSGKKSLLEYGAQMADLEVEHNKIPMFECFAEFRRWLCGQYEFYLRDKEVWQLLTDYGYEGSELAIFFEFYTNFQYIQKCAGTDPWELRHMVSKFIKELK